MNSNARRVFAGFLVLILASLSGRALRSDEAEQADVVTTFPSRTWTDATGKHSVSAAFIELTDGKVKLQRTDGKQGNSVIHLKLEQLSEADIKYVKFHTHPDAFVLSTMGIENYADLTKFIDESRNPQEIVAVLEAFAACSVIPEADRELARKQLARWRPIAEEKRVFVGKRWMLPAELERVAQEEDRLLVEAWRLIEVNQDQVAAERLAAASKLHPGAIRADFTLGLLNALISRHAPTAEKHFRECLNRLADCRNEPSNTRTANLAATLNNLALSEIRQANHSDAIKHFREAAMFNPSPEILQNVHRYAALAGRQRLKSLPPSATKDIAGLYASLLSSAGDARVDESHGWLYMRLVAEPNSAKPKEPAPDGQRPAPTARTSTPESGQRRVVGSGTGFVIAPGYLLTNQHVAGDAEGLSIVEPSSGKGLTGQLVAVADGMDLALVHCAELKAPAISLAASVPRRGTEIMILGYPNVTRFGANLKTTRGIVTALPSPESRNMCMFDAGANPGNSGGPVCDASGQTVAVLTLTTTREFHNYTYGVPTADAIAFVKQHLPNYQSPAASSARLDWPDVDELVSKSTVLILIEKTDQNIGFERRPPQSTEVSPDESTKQAWNAYEDPWCMSCNGHGQVECPDRSCARGTVKSYRQEVIGRNTITGAPLTRRVPIRVRCTSCGGDGAVDCRDCYRGRER